MAGKVPGYMPVIDTRRSSKTEMIDAHLCMVGVAGSSRGPERTIQRQSWRLLASDRCLFDDGGARLGLVKSLSESSFW
jgi:hypothetical protein